MREFHNRLQRAEELQSHTNWWLRNGHWAPGLFLCTIWHLYRVVHSKSEIYRIIELVLVSALNVELHLGLGVEHSVALLCYAHLAIKIIKLSQSRLTGPMSVVQLIARATVSPPPRDPVGRTKSLKLSCCCRRRVLFRWVRIMTEVLSVSVF